MEVGEVIDKIKSVPRWARWLGILTCGILASVGANYYVVHSKEELIKEKERNIAKLERELRGLKRVEKEYEIVLKSVQETKKELLKSLNELEQGARTVETLKAVMLSSPVKVEVIEKIEKGEKAPASKGALREGQVALYWEVTKERVVAEGAYGKVKKWIKSIEDTGVSIDQIKIRRENGLKGTVESELTFSYKTLVGANALKKKLSLIEPKENGKGRR